MFLYQTERSDHLKSISSLFYHKIPVSTPKTSPVSGFSAPCTSVLPKSVGLCEFFTKSTIFSDKPTPRRSKKGLLQRTPSVTASPCQLPLGGSLGVTVSGESLPLRGRWHRVSDDGGSSATAFLRKTPRKSAERQTSSGILRKIPFSSCQTRQNALFYSHDLAL